ncbi:putative membrane protein (plasmid) [Rhizobium favelukesii]|uniref:Membrane protein n=1 Tax=Rhizobium favelukesii TaxID=348824 RepID=W6RJF1_9HYPH|nr:putative membrane protein [Rhizobium favelukesii]
MSERGKLWSRASTRKGRQALQFMLKKKDSLVVINDNLEILLTVKRFGMWLMGLIIAVTSAVGQDVFHVAAR